MNDIKQLFEKAQKQRLRKTHYDSKGEITLQFSDGYFQENNELSSVYGHKSTNEIIIDDEEFHTEMGASDFSVAAAKAYESIDDEEDVFLNEEIGVSMAKAFDEEGWSQAYENNDVEGQVPLDEGNEYSDVFETDEELLFEETDDVEPEVASELSLGDFVDDQDDQFAKDLQAVLSGQKSLANLAEYADVEENSPKPEAKTNTPLQVAEQKIASDEAIFDQLAADRARLTTHQLGEVELTSIFDSADDEAFSETKQIMNPDEVKRIVDSSTTVAMSGMDLAEDFELMDAIGQDDLKTSVESHAHTVDEPLETEFEEVIVED